VDGVTADFERWSYHTAVAKFMGFVNELYRYVQAPGAAHADVVGDGIDVLLQLLAPACPHICAELWSRRHDGDHVHLRAWPLAEEALLVVDEIEIPVQVKGKVRARIRVAPTLDAAALEALALAEPAIVALLDGASPRKVIAVPGKTVNIVP